MNLAQSQAIFEAAQSIIPGGVNSPVRAYKSVGGTPPHIAQGSGAHVTDLDGNRYVDMVLSYGPLILGHGHPAVRKALHEAVDRGTSFGAPTAGELSLAQTIAKFMPALEKVRLVNSGTEATMSALRVARAATGRNGMIKFDGCYHGHGDSFLVRAGSGALTLGAPDSPGVPPELAALTRVAPYNDLAAVEALFKADPEGIACIFLEPVAGNMGCIPPEPGFLEGLRALCDRFGALLVFDEVMTGFRVAKGGYMQCTPVKPDLVCIGKIIGGGLPVGAYGGRRDLMALVAPEGAVYQAGTLSGNPLAVAAGLATLCELDAEGVYEHLEARAKQLADGLEELGRVRNIPLTVQRSGSMLCAYMAKGPIRNLDDVQGTDRARWNVFFQGMLERGILLPPSPFEAWFLSTQHDAEVIGTVLEAARGALQ